MSRACPQTAKRYAGKHAHWNATTKGTPGRCLSHSLSRVRALSLAQGHACTTPTPSLHAHTRLKTATQCKTTSEHLPRVVSSDCRRFVLFDRRRRALEAGSDGYPSLFFYPYVRIGRAGARVCLCSCRTAVVWLCCFASAFVRDLFCVLFLFARCPRLHRPGLRKWPTVSPVDVAQTHPMSHLSFSLFSRTRRFVVGHSRPQRPHDVHGSS